MLPCCAILFFCHCRTYSAANACSNLESSGAMMKHLSSAFSLWVIPTFHPITFCVNGLWPVRIWWRKRVKLFRMLNPTQAKTYQLVIMLLFMLLYSKT